MTIAPRTHALVARSGRCASPLRRDLGLADMENGCLPGALGMQDEHDMKSEAQV
jgi:hypothetical protein